MFPKNSDFAELDEGAQDADGCRPPDMGGYDADSESKPYRSFLRLGTADGKWPLHPDSIDAIRSDFTRRQNDHILERLRHLIPPENDEDAVPDPATAMKRAALAKLESNYV